MGLNSSEKTSMKQKNSIRNERIYKCSRLTDLEKEWEKCRKKFNEKGEMKRCQEIVTMFYQNRNTV